MNDSGCHVVLLPAEICTTCFIEQDNVLKSSLSSMLNLYEVN